MVRKQLMICFEPDLLERLDALIIKPCNRSDLFCDSMAYLLENEDTLRHFITKRNEAALQRAIEINERDSKDRIERLSLRNPIMEKSLKV